MLSNKRFISVVSVLICSFILVAMAAEDNWISGLSTD